MIRLYRIFGLAIVFSIIVIFTATVAAQNIEESSEPLGQEAVIKDSEEYALAMDVTLEEAMQRLSFQKEIGDLEAQLSMNEQSTYGGLWVQHRPEYRVIVQFTTKMHRGVMSKYVTDKQLATWIETRIVPISLEQLLDTQEQTLAVMEELGIRTESGIRVSENIVELYVLKEDVIDNTFNKANIELPSYVRVIEVDKLSREDTNIFAGLSLSTCTSSFSVKNGNGTKGVTTAAHCRDNQSYNGSNLTFQNAAYGGQYDVQWHTASGFTVRNLAYDGAVNRYIWGTKHHNSQYEGEWVCGYGKVTGYRCGQISDKYYQPHPNDCFYCFTSTFIRVHRDGVILGSGGDSGGPWMYGNTAYGIHHGTVDSNGDGIYMAINYISFLGLTVLTN